MRKTCTKCNIEKSIEDFHKCSKAKDGKNWECKVCVNKRVGIDQKKIKDWLNEKRRNRRQNEPEYRKKLAEIKKKSYWNQREAAFLRQAKQALKRRGIPCDLELKDIIIPEVCPVFKIPFDRGRFAPSLDRKDNNKHYTKDNIWIISNLANRMKNDATLQELEIFCKNIHLEINKNETNM